MSQKEPKGYDSALKELNKILSQLDDDNVGIDTLAEKIQRAKFLVGFCKTRLRDIEEQVNDEEE